jgi:pimeloyl-ACP methyl ester carboxylesterase
MTPEQARASARLAGRFAGGVVSHVEGVHRTIARRSFGATRPASGPVRAVHDGVAGTTYRIVRSALQASGEVAGVAAGALTPRSGRPAGTAPAANHAVAALNAVVGHALALDGDPLAITMGVRVAGRDVPLTTDALATATPERTGRLVVFVHGLGEHERSWGRRADDPGYGGTYGSRLAADLGFTPVLLRYNTGRHISDSGRDLSRLLTELLAAWPGEVDEVVLIGHSMGGLVIRAACHVGDADSAPWVPLVTHAIYLGSPHTGAGLARTARLAGWALDKVPEARPYGRAIDHSPGIRDLRFGYIVEADWASCDDGTCRIDHRTDVPLLATAHHHVISAALAGEPRSASARIVGDLLVRPSSAHGRRRDRRPIDFEPERRRHLERLHHLDLLNHPTAYEVIRGWLGPAAVDAG